MSIAPVLPSKRRAIQGPLLHVIASLLWLPQAGLLAWGVDGMLKGRDWHSAMTPVFGLLGLGVLRAVAEAWGARLIYRSARDRLTLLRASAAQALAQRSPLDRQRPPSGQAASVMAEQSEAIIPYLVRYQPACWRTVCLPVAILAAVAPMSWLAALVLAVAAPLIPLFMILVGLGARAASRTQMVEMGSMNAFLLDRLRGLASLRALGAVEATAGRLASSAQSLRQRTMAVLRIAFLSSAVLELFSALGVAMVAAYIGFSLLGTLTVGSWGQRLGLGQAMFILLLAPAFFEPLRELAAAWHDKAAGQAGLDALNALAAPQAAVRLPGSGQSSTALIPSAQPPSVSIMQLDFAYPGEAQRFRQFNLEVQAGEHLALLGTSGAGKSTLLSLLAGLVPASAGEIHIGGVRLVDANVDAARQRMAWIGQRPHIFSASVARNLTLGRAVADAAALRRTLQLADLAGVTQAQPQIMLSDGGHGLSGGEAVRLALARAALAPQADLLLVDEPTAHLDRETAARVIDALCALAQGKTMLVATHDPELVKRLHRSINLDAVSAV